MKVSLDNLEIIGELHAIKEKKTMYNGFPDKYTRGPGMSSSQMKITNFNQWCQEYYDKRSWCWFYVDSYSARQQAEENKKLSAPVIRSGSDGTKSGEFAQPSVNNISENGKTVKQGVIEYIENDLKKNGT